MSPRDVRRGGPANRARSALAALLLTVLAVLGGATTANGAAPVLTATAATTPTTATAVTDRAGAVTDRAPAPAAGEAPGPATASGALADVDRATHEHPRAEADPAQAPRAGTGRAFLLSHAPPPPHDALTPRHPGPAVPRAGAREAAEASFGAPRWRTGALPGVRGPPERTTGRPAGRPSCSADPAPRPR
ncbi:hypothetical protein [Streptomyces sp. NPDC101181]|uniref:hypothetical protein n=1 Tax=Streptomyces sp. NPDC101181 TaxID=3366125 RepID=UPI003824084D